MTWTHPGRDPSELKPDWAAYDREVKKTYYSASDRDPEQPLTFAIGDSKMCQKWKSDWIHKSLAAGYTDPNPAIPANGIPLQKTHRVTKERLLPLEQLATYCRFGETRYGFILTQNELVVFRMRRLDLALIPTGPGATAPIVNKPHAGLEYRSVPWQASGSGKLTANFAIWALCCMGMNDRHRIMETSDGEPLASMVRLTKWTYDEKIKVYRNDISGREISEEGWKKLGDEVAFVKLDHKQEGASYTSTFTTRGGVASITQGIQAMNMNTITSSTRSRRPAQAAAQQAKFAGQGSASSSKSQPEGQVAEPSNKLKPSSQIAASSSQAQPAGQSAASSSKPRPGPTLPPEKFTIAGKKGAPAYEMGVSNGKRVLEMEKTQVPVEVDSDKQQYYYIDPKTKNKVYLAQV